LLNRALDILSKYREKNNSFLSNQIIGSSFNQICTNRLQIDIIPFDLLYDMEKTFIKETILSTNFIDAVFLLIDRIKKMNTQSSVVKNWVFSQLISRFISFFPGRFPRKFYEYFHFGSANSSLHNSLHSTTKRKNISLSSPTVSSSLLFNKLEQTLYTNNNDDNSTLHSVSQISISCLTLECMLENNSNNKIIDELEFQDYLSKTFTLLHMIRASITYESFRIFSSKINEKEEIGKFKILSKNIHGFISFTQKISYSIEAKKHMIVFPAIYHVFDWNYMHLVTPDIEAKRGCINSNLLDHFSYLLACVGKYILS
jgi:hypothetical protein